MKSVKVAPSFYFIGDEKSSKNVLYLSLSAHDSLMTPPFCNPALMLVEKGIRVLSITLPNHEGNEKPQNIQELWSSSYEKLEEFFQTTCAEIEALSNEIGPISAVIGLSRGAFVGAHLAARIPYIKHVLGFAPLTFLPGHPSITILKSALASKNIRFYIGHHDTRVGTSEVIHVIKEIIDEATKQKIGAPLIDLVIKPSVGFKGHGTLDPVFLEGVSWLISNL